MDDIWWYARVDFCFKDSGTFCNKKTIQNKNGNFRIIYYIGNESTDARATQLILLKIFRRIFRKRVHAYKCEVSESIFSNIKRYSYTSYKKKKKRKTVAKCFLIPCFLHDPPPLSFKKKKKNP